MQCQNKNTNQLNLAATVIRQEIMKTISTTNLIEEAVKDKALELLANFEQNFSRWEEPVGEMDSDGNMPGYLLIAKYGESDDFGEDTMFYKIFRRLLFQGQFGGETVKRMKNATDPQRGESYNINDIIAFGMGATHKKYRTGIGLSFLVCYYIKMSHEDLTLLNLADIDCSEI